MKHTACSFVFTSSIFLFELESDSDHNFSRLHFMFCEKIRFNFLILFNKKPIFFKQNTN